MSFGSYQRQYDNMSPYDDENPDCKDCGVPLEDDGSCNECKENEEID